jgi:hypothetical protein
MKHALIAGAVAPARPLPPTRRSRGPWAPTAAGPYRLPRQVEGELVAALTGFRNREAAFALAHFLARFWSSPRRLLCAIPVDRRALAEHEALGLTEARVRGALATLVEIGFLARYEPEAGKRYQRTETGLQRRAILHRFGEAYANAFTAANARSQAARGAPAPARRPVPRPEASRQSSANVAAPRPIPLSQVAQKQGIGEAVVIMGEQESGLREPLPALEEALARWRRAIEG